MACSLEPAIMAASQPCPLEPNIFDEGGKMDWDRVKAMETHIFTDRSCLYMSTDGYCARPPLKEVVLKGWWNQYSGIIDYTTPLLMACAEGDLVVVERIVELWGVDVNTAATYFHRRDEDITNPTWHQAIEEATPLFVAAINGHDPVVRFLLGKGADISAKTSGYFYKEMTPLHGALRIISNQDSELNANDYTVFVPSPLREKKTAVVRSLLESGADPSYIPEDEDFPNWMTNLCKSNTTAITALINSGMSLEQRGWFGKTTVLHYWASNPLDPLESRTEEESPLAVVKLLVEKGADLMALDRIGFSPILHAAIHFQAQTSRENFSILEFLLEQDSIDLKEKIDALELIGATIFSDPKNAHLFQTAFDCWRRALHLRQMETEGSGPLFKIPMKRKKGLTTEWATSNELEYVAHHPSDYLVQAGLVRLRIYSTRGWEAAQDIFCTLGNQSKFIEHLNIAWAVLETIGSLQLMLQPIVTCRYTISIVQRIVNILTNLEKSNPLLTTETIKTSLELILSAEKVHKNVPHHQSYYRTLLKLITMLSGHPEMLNEETKALLDDLVQLERPTFKERTLLHIACNDNGTFADFATVCLLVKCGNDPNAGDSYGNGPLHRLFLLYTGEADEKWYWIARLLIDSGAHLDRINKEGKTAADFWTVKRNRWKCNKNRLPDWCYETLPSRLMCLSARVIRSHTIHYTEETLPISLHKFIQMH